jgi:hypothetical protein
MYELSTLALRAVPTVMATVDNPAQRLLPSMSSISSTATAKLIVSAPLANTAPANRTPSVRRCVAACSVLSALDSSTTVIGLPPGKRCCP